MLEKIVKQYAGQTTSEGHVLIVKKGSGHVTIGFEHAGEFEDEYDPFINVARVEQKGDDYRVGWFYDDGEEPSDSNEYSRQEDLVAALDKAIARRSKEVGRTAE